MFEFKLNRLCDYSDEAIIKEIRRVAELLNERPLTISSFKRSGKVDHTTITRRFGNWENALRRAGLDDSYINTKYKKLSKELLIQELQRVANVLKTDSFTANEFEQNSSMSRTSHVFYREFGSFKKAMEAAGLIPPIVSKRYSDEERYDNLLKVWAYYGRQPSYSEMKKPPSTVGPKAYVNKWGSWSKALLAFIERVNLDVDEQEKEESSDAELPIMKRSRDNASEEEKREIKIGLRYKVFLRDNFKCKKCGDSPAINYECRLHVDHIVPFSKGGKTIFDNLQTLCERCNLGKGNKFTR
jgi:hypothetical protein